MACAAPKSLQLAEKSAGVDRQSDEAATVVGLNLEQRAGAAVLLRLVDNLGDVAGIGDLLVVDRGNLLAFLHALVGSVGSGSTPVIADALAIIGRTDGEAEIGKRLFRGRLLRLGLLRVVVVRSLVLVGRQRAEFDSNRLGLAVTPQRDIDLGARLHRADTAGEIARILDRVAIDGGHNVAILDAGLLAGRAVLRGYDERTARLGQAEDSAMSLVTGWICTPSQPRDTVPVLIRSVTTFLAVVAGIAKAMPTLPPDGERWRC